MNSWIKPANAPAALRRLIGVLVAACLAWGALAAWTVGQHAGAGPAVAAAVREAPAWYAAHEQVYKLDVAASYAAETNLVIGNGPGGSAAGFASLEEHLSQAIDAEQATFASAATAGAGAYAGLQAGLAIAALLMAGACALGLSRRLAEYR